MRQTIRRIGCLAAALCLFAGMFGVPDEAHGADQQLYVLCIFDNGTTRVFDEWFVNNRLENALFTTKPNAKTEADCIVPGAGTMHPPAFLSIAPRPDGSQYYVLDAANADQGEYGTIRYEENGITYSMPVYIQAEIDHKENGDSGYWDGNNTVPGEEQIVSHEQLYERGSIKYEPLGMFGVQCPTDSEMWVKPNDTKMVFRLYRSEHDGRIYNCIRSAKLYSFPDFMSNVCLGGGGQWTCDIEGAKVGDTGTVTFFEDGILYSMIVRVVDPLSDEILGTAAEDPYEGYTAEELKWAASAMQEAIDEYYGEWGRPASYDQIRHIETELKILKKEITPYEQATEDEREANQQAYEDLKKVEEVIKEDEIVSATYDLAATMSLKDGDTLATVERDITVSELTETVEVTLRADAIKDSFVRVVRVHQSEAKDMEITEIDREAGTVTFKTDRFSTYAVVTSKTLRVNYLERIVITEYGKTIEAPADAEKKGYTIAGWYTDEALTDPMDFTKPLTDHLTIYPEYVKKSNALVYIAVGVAVCCLAAVLFVLKRKKAKV